jgi:hypothetical protein
MNDDAALVKGEPRWLAALGIAFLIVLPLLLPERYTLGPSWVLSAAEAALLVAIIVSDPGRIDNRSRSMRRLSLGLLGLFVLGDVAMTTLVVVDLVNGTPELNEAVPLSPPAASCGSTTTSYSACCTGSSTAAARRSGRSAPGSIPTLLSPST